MNALVTGATGFIGSHLVRRLVREGAQVSVLMRSSADPWRLRDIMPRLNCLQGDLSSLTSLAGEIKRAKPEVIYHLGWQGASSHQFQNDPAQVFANLPGSLELVQLAAECGCRAWIGMGSVLEYGNYPVPVTEEQAPRPVTLYGAAKFAVGLLAQKLCAGYGIRSAWFRLFWAYGPGDDTARMIPYLIGALLKGERPALTPGEQKWDYLFIDDVVEALWRAAAHPGVQGVYNLGSGAANPLREVVERIRDFIDPSLPLGFGELPYRPDQIMHLQADISRLRKAMNWEPAVEIQNGLRRTVEWFRLNRNRYV